MTNMKALILSSFTTDITSSVYKWFHQGGGLTRYEPDQVCPAQLSSAVQNMLLIKGQVGGEREREREREREIALRKLVFYCI